jgi:hypothetical protein
MDRDFGRGEFEYNNPYYNPEKCGLELVLSFDEPGLDYEFNTFLVWRDIESGNYYCASDSGCSCPTPFEDFGKLSDLTYIDSERSAKGEFDSWNVGYDGKNLVSPMEAYRDIEALFEDRRKY